MEGGLEGVSELTIDARLKVKALIEFETIRTGSRMAAYEAIAQRIGVSPVWLRHFACGYPTAKLDVTLWNIHAVYQSRK